MARILYTLPDSGRRGRKRTFIRLLAPRNVFLFIALVAAGGAGIFSLRHPYARIARIEVLGAQSVSGDEIRSRAAALLSGSYAFVIPKDFFGLVNAGAIKKTLEKDFLRIADAEVIKEFPDSLRISVRERSSWAIACPQEIRQQLPQSLPATGTPAAAGSLGTGARRQAPACVFIDENGFAYEEAPRTFGALVRTLVADAPPAVGGFVVDASTMGFLKAVSEGSEKLLGSPIVEYQILSRTPGDVRLKTREGFSLIVTQEASIPDSLRVLERVLAEEIKEKRGRLDYIDLRFGNKVFYKIKK
ncbi:MAG: FtsQ-type POTRA domain-containing protein [Candidatus Sungbacteria bacterium]|nr:FtsQ-type POTRA domain-containing protein [Candidatus Sungbacteria bacterium]